MVPFYSNTLHTEETELITEKSERWENTLFFWIIHGGKNANCQRGCEERNEVIEIVRVLPG